MRFFYHGWRYNTSLLSLLLLLIFFQLSCFSQSKAIAELVKEDKHSAQLFFYPSTLRMLNLTKDPALYALTEQVKHLRLLTYDNDSFLLANEQTLVKSLVAEGFEELMMMHSDSVNFQVYGSFDGNDVLGMAAVIVLPGQGFVVELDGFLDPMKAYNMVNKGIDMPVLSGFFKDRSEGEERQKKYREFRNGLEDEGQAKKDSLSNSSGLQDTLSTKNGVRNE